LRCYQCRTPVVDVTYITIDEPSLGKRVYHELHFFCAECGDPFVDPKSLHRNSTISGLAQTRVQGSDQDRPIVSKPFVAHQGHAYCENCHVNLRKPKCGRCRKPIREDVIQAMGKKFHEECFVCEVRARGQPTRMEGILTCDENFS
jgi:paxillin